jgi:hypothetical protein
MNSSILRLRWLRILGAALAVVAFSFVALLVLACQARGAPDQSAINRFAAQISPRLMPWLECLLALILAFTIGRKTHECSTIQGLLVGILAGMLGLAVALIFRGHLSSSAIVFSFGVAGAGCIGGLLGKKWPAR